MNLKDTCDSLERLLEARPMTCNEHVYWEGWIKALLTLGEAQRVILGEWPGERRRLARATIADVDETDLDQVWGIFEETERRFEEIKANCRAVLGEEAFLEATKDD